LTYLIIRWRYEAFSYQFIWTFDVENKKDLKLLFILNTSRTLLFRKNRLITTDVYLIQNNFNVIIT